MPTIFDDKVTAVPKGKTGVTFNDLVLPSGAVSFGLDVLDGWSSTPEMDEHFTPIGTVDGEIPGDFFPEKSRLLTIGGWAFAQDRLSAETLKDAITRDAFPRNTDVVLSRYEPIPKFVTGRRVGQVVFDHTGPYAFRWGAQLRCGDPFKYAVTSITDSGGVAGRSSGGRSYPRTYPLTYTTIVTGADDTAVINNTGTANSSPYISIHGPLVSGGWHLTNLTTGADLKIDVGVPSATDILYLDFKNEVVTLNGVLVSATIRGDFWDIVPGVNTIKLYADFDPAAGFTVTAYSAWE